MLYLEFQCWQWRIATCWSRQQPTQTRLSEHHRSRIARSKKDDISDTQSERRIRIRQGYNTNSSIEELRILHWTWSQTRRETSEILAICMCRQIWSPAHKRQNFSIGFRSRWQQSRENPGCNIMFHFRNCWHSLNTGKFSENFFHRNALRSEAYCRQETRKLWEENARTSWRFVFVSHLTRQSILP